ncbi:(5-formylfuran-3-yl)methyl phosphate synthase [Methyloglobulus sp.]|uniref:(5-formylfuran-3-yl)methyl phosphate synthase n=1 Tax=Methyloglobulus sp. TaxID=2518622 RepID=UPI0039892388
MTGMLASVNSVDEAKLVLAENIDIIDLKEPALGSLGGLDIGLVKQIVAVVNGQCPTSATIGDLPMQPEFIFNAVKEMAETGVNYVKIGFFASENQVQVIEKLALIAAHINLIAVLFADTHPDFSLIDKLIAAGFRGIMLDTLDKTKGSLTRIMAKAEIERFVVHVKSRHTICGLAGSLKLEDIPLLMSYQPDYLGFRGALCDQHERAGRLNVRSVQAIKQAIADFSC